MNILWLLAGNSSGFLRVFALQPAGATFIMSILSHKIELKPNKAQAEFFQQCAGTARFIWNRSLAQWKQEYEVGGKPSAYGICASLTTAKREDPLLEWLNDIPRAVLDNSVLNLGTAFKNFFRKLKQGDKKAYPNFKRKGIKEGFNPWYGGRLHLSGKNIKIPRLGWVRMRETLRFSGRLIQGVVSQTAGRWFLAITIELSEPPQKARTGESQTGVDLGCSTLATLSTGDKIEGPKPLKKLFKKLQRLSRRLSKKQKGSNRGSKAKQKLARLHYRISNIRKAAIHELTTRLILENKVIAIEDLCVKGMQKLKTVARSLVDQSFYEIRRQLDYKSRLYGSEIVVVSRWFPSSKMCSNCGHIKDKLALSERTYQCKVCGFVLDRDINAAINLKNQLGPLGSEVTLGENVGLPASLSREVIGNVCCKCC